MTAPLAILADGWGGFIVWLLLLFLATLVGGALLAGIVWVWLYVVLRLTLSRSPLAEWGVRRRRRASGLCLACGYRLTGNVSGVCPECGTPVRR
jgi:hypothetical protein